MAARRIAVSSVNWISLSERVPEHQRALYAAFKAKADGYLKAVQDLPEQPPAIDWSFYKAKVPIRGMVDEFQKQYSALNIPFPEDKVSSQIDAQENDVKISISSYKSESDGRIAQYKKQLTHLASLLPYDQMTMEDFKDSYPEEAIDPINKPTFWPHTPEDQIGYAGDKPEPSHH